MPCFFNIVEFAFSLLAGLLDRGSGFGHVTRMNKPTLGASCPVYLHFFSPLYGFAWRLARPFLAKHKRLQQGLASRLVPQNWVPPYSDGLTIWIQAASGGEAYLLVKLWRQIREEKYLA